jgi:hypothetical protein
MEVKEEDGRHRDHGAGQARDQDVSHIVPGNALAFGDIGYHSLALIGPFAQMIA